VLVAFRFRVIIRSRICILSLVTFAHLQICNPHFTCGLLYQLMEQVIVTQRSCAGNQRFCNL